MYQLPTSRWRMDCFACTEVLLDTETNGAGLLVAVLSSIQRNARQNQLIILP